MSIAGTIKPMIEEQSQKTTLIEEIPYQIIWPINGRTREGYLIPELLTPRLRLRPFGTEESLQVHQMVNTNEVAPRIGAPFPYLSSMAFLWITSHANLAKVGERLSFAITRKTDGQLVGSISIKIDKQHHKGSLGWWIGQDYWNNGYATEAALAIEWLGFKELHLNRLEAQAHHDNHSSQRVMQKLGFKLEGKFPQAYFYQGEYKDIVQYGILAKDYLIK